MIILHFFASIIFFLNSYNRDLISQIDNFRRKRLDKNGFIDLFCRRKTDESSAKFQYFNIFEDIQNEDNENKEDLHLKNRKLPEVTLDSIGLHRAKQQFRSQPRNLLSNPKVNANKSINIDNGRRNLLDFSKKDFSKKGQT